MILPPKWYTKAKWPTQRRQKIHSHKPDTSNQSSHLQELVPSNLTKIPFGHVILEDRQSFATDLMWALHTQKPSNWREHRWNMGKVLHAVLQFCPQSYLFPEMFTFDWRVLCEIQFTRDSECARQNLLTQYQFKYRFETSPPVRSTHESACLHCSLCWTAYSFTSHFVSITFLRLSSRVHATLRQCSSSSAKSHNPRIHNDIFFDESILAKFYLFTA